MIKKAIGLVGFLILPAIVTAQRATVTQPTEWFALNSNIKFHKRIGFAFDSQARFVGDLQSYQHYIRNGIEIYITPKLAIVPIGYMYVWNFQYGKQPAKYINNEHRIWQQIVYKQKFKIADVSHRLRFEERYIQKHSTAPDGSVIDNGFVNHQFRMRYRLMANIPINHSKMDPKTWYINIWDELFMSWGKSVTYHHPDQNRIFIGLGYQFSKMVSLQGGFLYQLLIKSNGTQQENNVGGMIQLNYNFDFSKK